VNVPEVMKNVMLRHVAVASLEEQVLRALFEAPASARECAVQLRPFDRPATGPDGEIIQLLRELSDRAYVSVHIDAFETRYALTVAGSQHLADLVEFG
jgi:hypothetical protein